MPRAFLLKRQYNDNNDNKESFLSTRQPWSQQREKEDNLLKKSEEEKVKRKKREKLSKMINDIRMAITRDDGCKPCKIARHETIRTEPKRFDNLDRNKNFYKKHNFSVENILTHNRLKNIGKIESINSAFVRPSKALNQDKYKEYFDIKPSLDDLYPHKKQNLENSASFCTKPCCRKSSASPIWRDEEVSLSYPRVKYSPKKYSPKLHSPRTYSPINISPKNYSPTSSNRSVESGSADSFSSAGNAVNIHTKYSPRKFDSQTHESAEYADRRNCKCVQCCMNNDFLRRSDYNNHEPLHNAVHRSEYISHEIPHSAIPHNERKYAHNSLEIPHNERKYAHSSLEIPHNELKYAHNSLEVVSKRVNTKTISRKKTLLKELEIEGKIDLLSNDKHVKKKQKVSSPPHILLQTGGNKSRTMANLLERRRVAELNSAFENLRDIVPLYGNEDRSLSKIKTLRYAIDYMQHLSLLLNKHDHNANESLIELSRHDPTIEKFRENLVKRNLII